MFEKRYLILFFIFMSLLVITSSIKNETRLIEKKISILKEKILLKEKNINETELDFYYLTSPAEIEKRLNLIGFKYYQPIEHSKIFFDTLIFDKIQSKTSKLKK
tara:strand:- start:117 stop:428 length:312 start_codon:yes stop_codon:yes gene_type:complete